MPIERQITDIAGILSALNEVFAEERKPGGLLDPATPSTFQLSDIKDALRKFLWYRKNETMVKFGFAASLAALIGVGYYVGKQR